jgi:hypothetical protein
MVLALSSCSTRNRFPEAGLAKFATSPGKDIWMASAEERIHDDAIVDLQTGSSRQFGDRLDPDPGHDAINEQFLGAARPQRDLAIRPLQTDSDFAWQHLDTVLPVILVQERRQIGAKDVFANPCRGE